MGFLKSSVLVMLLFGFLSLSSEALVFNSGKYQVNLLELYTSQGCSSCPPADRFLTHLKDDPDLWHKFVPIGFHVDYWNWIGFEDVYSTKANTERQKNYLRGGKIKAVYTPGFILNAREVRSWVELNKIRRSNFIKVGNLRGEIVKKNLVIQFENLKQFKGLFINVSVLGFDIVTPVDAGENANKVLSNDFVVLSFLKKPFDKREKISLADFKPDLNPKREFLSIPRLALVFWLSDAKGYNYFQASGGFLPKKLF